ncbi:MULTISPECIES: Zn-dependent hydrolase [Halolamina]|uniref:N-carbamoyl-L-amino-acid hydrolase n=1 Tax=Halolamina pelagica TaxID=699431 RepID=A0A1I5WDD2_9EURY|nr:MULTISPECIES: Zn-dependent hydrolase [Halolamina]NHX37950.1 Zn-dependent hydrolase [Halolamina sp. R1-12]SFQ17732.1 N-carbamoyl-L-amino-acid hydrolase [Halolamina pelagica]
MTEISSERLRDRFDRFNEIGATERGGVNRPTLSDANKRARDRLVEWFQDAGLEVTVDEVGNIFGRRAGRNDDLAPVLVGSHVDSQYNGGRYDGVIGVLGGLEIVETLNDAGVETERPIEVVSWSNEEGVRFQPDMLGSGVFAGKFDPEFARSLEDKEGKRFGEELERIGYRGDAPCEPRELHSYFELHVEQGPKLADAGLSVGVVEGVYGFVWFDVTFSGSADHAGPTPMHLRHDALVATSDVVEAVRRIAGTEGDDLVGTVGSLDVSPNSINVIPETVDFTVDFRSYDDETVDRAADRVREEIEHAAAREDVEASHEVIMRIESQAFDDGCIETVAAAADDVGADYTRLVSGAGHDASYLNGFCPTAMVFVPSVGGVSHTEDEYTEWTDVVTGTEVLHRAVLEKANEPEVDETEVDR